MQALAWKGLSEESNNLSYLFNAFQFQLIWICSISTDFNTNSIRNCPHFVKLKELRFCCQMTCPGFHSYWLHWVSNPHFMAPRLVFFIILTSLNLFHSLTDSRQCHGMNRGWKKKGGGDSDVWKTNCNHLWTIQILKTQTPYEPLKHLFCALGGWKTALSLIALIRFK